MIRLKLISSGRIINRLQTLQDQGVQNNQQVMAIVLDDEEGEASKSGSTYDKLSEARNDANLLLKKDDSYMDVSLLEIISLFEPIKTSFIF